jgi:hypothetical protein
MGERLAKQEVEPGEHSQPVGALCPLPSEAVGTLSPKVYLAFHGICCSHRAQVAELKLTLPLAEDSVWPQGSEAMNLSSILV